ncbi:hypothetical protein PENTCL1PPCAC_10011 [Pristionchus entomophagus]|uniref:Uncharacterized protein n=1 Tax=Pristionchus entomophagus TaxID=358040 RepID=A0AAV5SWX6_9BILA|nr:hypothetical protein PENTCL1PPCAC_10011 [Pristionchus entomophagus]
MVQLLQSTPAGTWDVREIRLASIIKNHEKPTPDMSLFFMKSSFAEPYTFKGVIRNASMANHKLITFIRSHDSVLMGWNFECEEAASRFFPFIAKACMEPANAELMPCFLPPPISALAPELIKLAEVEKQKREEVAAKDREILALSKRLDRLESEKPLSAWTLHSQYH